MIEWEDEPELLRRFVDGESVTELALAYGTTEEIVDDTLMEVADYTFAPSDEFYPDVPIANEDELIDRFVYGESISELALSYHTREAQVHAALNRASERMQSSAGLMNNTATHKDIERMDAQVSYMNRYADRLNDEAERIEAHADYMNRYTKRLNEEAGRRDQQSDRASEILAVLVVVAVIGFTFFVLVAI